MKDKSKDEGKRMKAKDLWPVEIQDPKLEQDVTALPSH